MSALNDQTEWQLNIDKTITEIEKNQVELRKFMADEYKAIADAKLSDKKIKWFEFTLGIAVAGILITLTATLTKFFLSS